MSAWEWELTLTGYGYDGHIEAVATAQQSVTDNRIEYQRGDLTEWYINDERGLEQGFTIQSPPQFATTRQRGSGTYNRDTVEGPERRFKYQNCQLEYQAA